MSYNHNLHPPPPFALFALYFVCRLFPRTAGKVNTFSTPETEASVSSTPSVQLHTPAIGGQSIFDTIKRTSMKTAALATTSTDSGISKSLDAVFASQAAGVDSVDHNVPDKADTAPTSQSSAASKPRSVRPRCIRMITPRINIQVKYYTFLQLSRKLK